MKKLWEWLTGKKTSPEKTKVDKELNDLMKEFEQVSPIEQKPLFPVVDNKKDHPEVLHSMKIEAAKIQASAETQKGILEKLTVFEPAQPPAIKHFKGNGVAKPSAT